MRAVLGSVVIDNKEVLPWQSAPQDASNAATSPLGNVLPLWVSVPGRASGEIITRTPDGAQRVYHLRMIALPSQPDSCASDDCDDPRVTTGLTFIYPAARKAAADQGVMQSRAAAAKRAAAERLKTDIFYGRRNWKYLVKGDPAMVKHLAPDQISDNTQVTGLLYLGNRHTPSLYIVEADGSERQVNATPDKDLVLVYETAARWRLRSGTEVIDLYNSGFDAIGVNPYTGTVSPSVVRVTRAQQK